MQIVKILNNMSFLVAIYIKSHPFPFNSCGNVYVLQNQTSNTTQIICHHLEVAYQLFYSPDKALILI